MITVHMVANINIHDRERYSQYEAGFMEFFARYQGTLLTVDDTPFNRTVLIT